MALLNNYSRAQAAGSGATVRVDFSWTYLDDDHITATAVRSSDGAVSAATLVVEDDETGTYATVTNPWGAGVAIVALVERGTPPAQEFDPLSAQPFSVPALEAQLDRTMMTVQELVEKAARAITSDDPFDIPDATARALAVLGFDADGDPVLTQVGDFEGYEAACAAAQAAAESAQAAAEAAATEAAAQPRLLHGTGAPADGTGSNGDYYIDTAADTYYGPKAAGTWTGTGPVSMAGTAGPQGEAGAAGAAGPAGADGAAGAPGVDGADGAAGTGGNGLRQCVVAGERTSAGAPDYLGGVGTTTLTIRASAGDPLVASFADGFDDNGPHDYLKRLVANLTVGSLTANAVLYPYLDYNPATGAVTAGVAALPMAVAGARVPQVAGPASTPVGPMLSSQHAAETCGAMRAGILNAAGEWLTFSTSPTSLADPSYPPWRSFRGERLSTSANGYNGCALKADTTGGAQNWRVCYDFGTAKTVTAYAIGLRQLYSGTNEVSTYPRTWYLEGSNNGTSWTTLDTRTDYLLAGTTQEKGWEGYWAVASPGSYRYYRLRVTKTRNGFSPTMQAYNCTVGQVRLFAAVGSGVGDEFRPDTMTLHNVAGTQVWRVYLGKVTTGAAGVISAIVANAFGCEADTGVVTLTAVGTTLRLSHNLGVVPQDVRGLFWDACGLGPYPVAPAAAGTSTTVYYGAVLGLCDAYTADIYIPSFAARLAGDGTYKIGGAVKIMVRRGW